MRVDKDRLTFGMFSRIDSGESLKSELTKYSELAWGRQDKNFVIPVWEFPNLYRELCARFYFAPVNQQLIESIFSKVNGCILSTDPPEIDALRIGQLY